MASRNSPVLNKAYLQQPTNILKSHWWPVYKDKYAVLRIYKRKRTASNLKYANLKFPVLNPQQGVFMDFATFITNHTTTLNGAVSNRSSLNACLDLFSMGVSASNKEQLIRAALA